MPTSGSSETYNVRITRKAQKELKKLGHQARDRITPAIRDLANDPRPHNCKKLKGKNDLYRIRSDYRAIYQVDDENITVLVVRVRHRREAYR
jgi:mRNA interferase RelE/StbE